MKTITVEELYELCKEQIQLGNGKKEIQLSRDDEGNGYHPLIYTFTTDMENLKLIEKENKFDWPVNIENIVILG